MTFREPDYLLALSIKLGEDLTPLADLPQRLESVVAVAKQCQSDLDKLLADIQNYVRATKKGSSP